MCSTQIGPNPDFSSWGGPADPRTAATGPEISLWVLLSSGDVVAIDNACRGLERGFFRSKMSECSEDSFFAYMRSRTKLGTLGQSFSTFYDQIKIFIQCHLEVQDFYC